MNSRIIFISLLLATVFFSCKKKETDVQEKEIEYTEKQARIISTVTNGKITSESKIEVRFIKSVITKDSLNIELGDNIFTFTPNIKGKAYWSSTNVLVFEPNKPLEYRESYSGTLNLKALSSQFVNEDIKDLEFKFDVIGPELSSFLGEARLKDRNNPKVLVYSGKLFFSENIEEEDLLNAISIKQGSNKYKVYLTKESNRSYTFISEDLPRDDKTRVFTFILENKPVGISETYTEEFEITMLGAMKLVNVIKDEGDKNPKIQLEFSDEFDFEQQVDGLITIDGLENIHLQRMGKLIIVEAPFKFGEQYTINVKEGIRSRWGTKTESDFSKTVEFPDIKPQVEFASGGFILPTTNEYKLQFYTSNLQRVHVEIKRVYDDAIREFLQTEQLSSVNDRHESFKGSYINRVGVIVHNETFEIGADKNEWKLNEIDLSNLVKRHNNGMFLVRLNFNPRDMLTDVSGDNYKHIEEFGQIYKPLIFSNIGITAKKTADDYTVYVTDITTCKPISGVKLYLKRYWRDDETISTGVSNNEGIAHLNWRHSGSGSYIEARKDNMVSVVKFNETQWNNSGFDISGISDTYFETSAFVYTERGVYRPGDLINLSVIARHKNQNYPDNKTLTVDLYNPQHKKVYSETVKKSTDGFYNFPFQTKESDPTGNWSARFVVGNKSFNHTVKIETVVPYKLKVKIEPETDRISSGTSLFNFDVVSNYLFGNPAANLSAKVEMEISERNVNFSAYEDFTFSNPAYDFRDISKKLFEGPLDENGKKSINWTVPAFTHVPSGLNMKITATVLEKGGRPNINWLNIPVDPYDNYVGIQKQRYSYVSAGKDVELPVILVDKDGKALSGRKITYRIYQNTTNWWWHYDRNRSLRYKTDHNTKLIKEGSVISKETHTKIKFLPIEAAQYLIEVIDESGTGHSSGMFLYAYRYGRSSSGDKNAGTLTLSGDKNKYYVGDLAKISFPAPKEGLVLMTVERENEILTSNWYELDGKEEMTVDVPINSNMVPNAYVSVSLMQPHSQTVNDRPIRMFGILPIMVEDRDSKHEIEIKTAKQFRPNEAFEVDLQTSDNRKTQFTIAVVDEGLLDITQFRTPDPWKHFFQKIRLDISTYDLFSQIIAANIGDVFKTFSIGGDMEDYRESQLQPEKGKKRFKPVCLFQGPIETDNNGHALVTFNMPEYVGSVRIMVIGARQDSYTRAEKAVPVKTELMTIPSLPRVIGPNESFTLPASIFAMEDNIGKVTTTVKSSGPIIVNGSASADMTFTKAGDKDCYFQLSTKNETGQGEVVLHTKSAKYQSKSTTNIMVRPSSPRIFKSFGNSVEPNSSISMFLPNDGIKGTNRATLSLAAYPGVNFGHRVKWLIQYPYGCIEQTTSAALPQLYLKKFIKFPEANAESIDGNINIALERLRQFQRFSGEFSYWPYSNIQSTWGSIYAGHFMVEAKKMGYYVSEDMYDNWLKFTIREARNNKDDLTTRCYRAYVLALAGEAPSSELNILFENELKNMENVQKWLLAAAFQLSGKEDGIEKILSKVEITTRDYNEFSGTYGSGLRDKGIILDALVALGKYTMADNLAISISKDLATTNWYSTQTTGYCLLAMGKYINYLQNNKDSYTLKGYVEYPGGEKVPFESDKTLDLNIDKDFGKNIKVVVSNETTVKKVYATLAWNGVPIKSSIQDESKNLSVKVVWKTKEGQSIHPESLKQGTSFYGFYTVKNLSAHDVNEIALVQILPSGWEIENTRLLDQSLPDWTKNYKKSLDREEYLDIRDDRVMWFFDLGTGTNNRELHFIVKLNAVTAGEYDLPPTLVEAMYNGNYKATIAGTRVKVTRP